MAKNRSLLAITIFTLCLILLFTYVLRVGIPQPQSRARGIFFLAAFLGGVLSVLSPCSLAVLPVFFSYSFSSVREQLKMTYVFFLGLLLIFIPLGFGTSLIAQAFSLYRKEFFIFSGLTLIMLGIFRLLDIHALSKMLSRISGAHSGALAYSGHWNKIIETYLMGAFFSFTTIACTGPILGAIITLSVATSLSSVAAMAYYVVFALGIVLPLLVLVLLWQKYRLYRIIKHRAVVIALFKRKIVTNNYNIISGAMMIVLGIVMLNFERASGLFSGFLGESGGSSLYVYLTEVIYARSNLILELLFIVLLIVAFIIIRRKSKKV